MLRAFFSSATGMRAQEVLIDVTANNLANVNTTGFKRHQVDFADLLYANLQNPGALTAEGQNSPVGAQLGSGTRVYGTTKNFTQGSVEQTGIPTDVAIQGPGFFKILLPNGQERYTRDGAFRMNAQGIFVNGDGHVLEGNITVPSNTPQSRISVGGTGVVSVLDEQGNATQTLGTIQLYQFQNPAGLSNEGNNLLAESPASGPALAGNPGDAGYGTLLGSYLERSNVEVVRELVSLITAQRAYEINSRAIRAGDEMLSTTSQIVR